MKSALIIGAGIVGLATAFKLRERFPRLKITILEKETSPGLHQSTHNSGVLHCGLYYRPGSLKARLAVDGIRQMIAFCRRHDVPHEICGKLVIAIDQTEKPRLDELVKRGLANGLSGLKELDRDGLRAIEPHANGIAAVHVPEEGIVDYAAVIGMLGEQLKLKCVEIQTNAKATAIQPHREGWIVRTPIGEFHVEYLINTAGLYCDRVAESAGVTRDVRIVPFRGEYYRLRPDAEHLCRHLIYPVPDPAFPFLGVHFTRMIHGGVEAGPNAVLAFSREGYDYSRVNLRDLLDAITFPGLWRFVKQYPSMAIAEFRQSLSKQLFCKALQRLIPDVRLEHLAPGGAGVRAQAMSPAGELLQDFHIVKRDRALHLLNAPSPGATASLAIGEYLTNAIP